jgi:hypothetical protein
MCVELNQSCGIARLYLRTSSAATEEPGPVDQRCRWVFLMIIMFTSFRSRICQVPLGVSRSLAPGNERPALPD